MKKRHSITVVLWPIILGVVGVAVTVSAIPDMTPEQLAAELTAAEQVKQQEAQTLATALQEEQAFQRIHGGAIRYHARRIEAGLEVNP